MTVKESIKIAVESANRRGKQRLPTAIPDPIGIARDYERRIEAMIDDYAEIVADTVTPAIESSADEVRMDSWVDRMQRALGAALDKLLGRSRKAQQEINEIAGRVGSHNQSGFIRQVKTTLAIDVTLNEPWLDDELKAWSAANASLVSSVAEQAHSNVSRMAMEGVRQGRSVRDIQKDLKKQYGLSKNRAKTIARTETAKLNSELSERRQTELGIDTYYWSTSRDERVRDSHRAMNGKLCRWDDPTVYSDDGGKTWKKRSGIGGADVHPGRDFQCRCTSRPNTAAILDQL